MNGFVRWCAAMTTYLSTLFVGSSVRSEIPSPTWVILSVSLGLTVWLGLPVLVGAQWLPDALRRPVRPPEGCWVYAYHPSAPDTVLASHKPWWRLNKRAPFASLGEAIRCGSMHCEVTDLRYDSEGRT